MSRGYGFAKLCNAGFKREVVGLCVTCRFFRPPVDDYAYSTCSALHKLLSEPGKAQRKPACEAYQITSDKEMLGYTRAWVDSMDVCHVSEAEQKMRWYAEHKARAEVMQAARRTALDRQEKGG